MTNTVEFIWNGKIISRKMIDWKFSKGDTFTFWGGLNKATQVDVYLNVAKDNTIDVLQAVYIEPINWNPVNYGLDKIEDEV